MPDPTPTLCDAPELAADWIPRLVAQQLTGLRDIALRSAVARGEVRIRPASGGRYWYSRRDCERLRQRRAADSHLPPAA